MSLSDTRKHYSFSISLRLTHPAMDPAEITRIIGIQPERSWRAGANRQTPTGSPLAGHYKETFWTSTLMEGRWPISLGTAVHDSLGRLVTFRAFLHKLRAEGGTAEFFIGWFFDNQSGEVFDYQCLALAGDLQIDLSFDVYPPMEQ